MTKKKPSEHECCSECGQKLPYMRRADRITCSPTCRVRRSRRRQRQS